MVRVHSYRGRWGVCRFVSVFVTVLLLSACGSENNDDLSPVDFSANPPVPLTSAEVETIIGQAAASMDASTLSVAVVDRVGNVLGLWSRDPQTTEDDLNKTVAIARSAAFLSSSQGPISSRTLEYISAFHFPPTFGPAQDLAFPTLPAQRAVTGVRDTPQGPLWQIFASNRGAPLAGLGLTVAETGEETLFNDLDPDNQIPPAVAIDGTAPSPGLGYLPGGIPLYKPSNGVQRLVGGVGCFGAPVNACEYAALQGARGFSFPGVRPEGAIFLVGILLPFVGQTTRPPGFGPGTFVFDAADFRVLPRDSTNTDPTGYLIGPRADPLGNLTLADVQWIVQQGIRRANSTRAAIRLPLGTTTKMVFAVTNLDGLILALYRMQDAPIFSVDVSVTKARTVVYYSGDALSDADAIPGVPRGTAITTRTLGFLSQPAFPPTIDGNAPGPLFDVAINNQNPAQYNRMGNAAPRPGLQSGLIFFPGSAPLYKNSVLVGGLGVSGDGVEEDDFVTAGAVRGFEPPAFLRADNFFFNNVPLPYFKFPQAPGPFFPGSF